MQRAEYKIEKKKLRESFFLFFLFFSSHILFAIIIVDHGHTSDIAKQAHQV